MSGEATREKKVTRENVLSFLAWYRASCPRLAREIGFEDQWVNALVTLNQSELRSGWQAFKRLQMQSYVPAVAFWHVCKIIHQLEKLSP